MGKINVRKRGKVYEYFFEGSKVNNKRTRISKSGFRTQNIKHYIITKSNSNHSRKNMEVNIENIH